MIGILRRGFEVYAFALESGLRLLSKGAFRLASRFWIAPVGYWRVFVDGMVLSHVQEHQPRQILDLSSPKLVSLLLAARTGASVTATDLDDARIFNRWLPTAELLGIADRYKV